MKRLPEGMSVNKFPAIVVLVTLLSIAAPRAEVPERWGTEQCGQAACYVGGRLLGKPCPKEVVTEGRASLLPGNSVRTFCGGLEVTPMTRGPGTSRGTACAGMENTLLGVFGVLSLLRISSRLARRTMYRRDLHCRWMLVLPLTVTLCLRTSLLSAAGDIDGQECTVDREYDVQTSIGCVGGSCNGELVVFLEQSSCKSKAGGGDFEESTEFLSITAPPKVKFLGYLKWARCSGGTTACLSCAAAAAAAAPTPPTAAALAVLCGAVCLITADPCCYNTCVLDYTRKIEEPGGKVCNR